MSVISDTITSLGKKLNNDYLHYEIFCKVFTNELIVSNIFNYIPDYISLPQLINKYSGIKNRKIGILKDLNYDEIFVYYSILFGYERLVVKYNRCRFNIYVFLII